MLKKFTALLLITAFTNAFAMAPVQEVSAMSKELERTFDQMNYSLNVEWDQKDAKFFKDTVDAFEKEVTTLQKKGLTNKELMAYTMTKIKDKQTQKDIAEISKVISESNMSSDEARAFALEKLNSTYSQGTSWSGSRLGIKMALILGVIILIVCIIKYHDNDDDCDDDRVPEQDPCEGGYSNGEGGCYYPIPQ